MDEIFIGMAFQFASMQWTHIISRLSLSLVHVSRIVSLKTKVSNRIKWISHSILFYRGTFSVERDFCIKSNHGHYYIVEINRYYVVVFCVLFELQLFNGCCIRCTWWKRKSFGWVIWTAEDLVIVAWRIDHQVSNEFWMENFRCVDTAYFEWNSLLTRLLSVQL